MALFQGGCEFPLLRERFWRLAAAGMPTESDRRMSNGTPSPGSRSLQQQHQATSSASPPTPPQPEHRSSSSQPRKSLRSAGTMSVDLGSLQQRRQEGNSGDYLSPAYGGRELSRSESEVPARKGRFGLRSLDLQALPRDDSGPPSEVGARRQKFAAFENACSEVAPGLCVGGGAVAQNRETLRAAGVTHIVNCVGMLVPNCFAAEIDYLTLFLLDNNQEDITSVMFKVFDYIEAARSSGGCVLVHCSQGVSRSAALTIGYLMWKLGRPYQEVADLVKAIRGVTNPNIGFACQLLHWQKRRDAAQPPGSPRLLRLVPAFKQPPLLLVPRQVKELKAEALDPRGAFLLTTPQHTFIWRGAQCSDQLAAAAEDAADAIERFEGVAAPANGSVHVQQGAEPPDFAAALQLPPSFQPEPCSAYDADFALIGHQGAQQAGSPARVRRTESAPAASPVCTDAPALALPPVSLEPAASGTPPTAPRPMPGLHLGPAQSAGAEDIATPTPRGSKTPRADPGSSGSPNTRRRKSARSDGVTPLSPGGPSSQKLDEASGGELETESEGSDSDSDSSASDLSLA